MFDIIKIRFDELNSYKRINELHKLIDGFEGSTFFHKPEWLNIVASSTNSAGFYLIVIKEDMIVQALPVFIEKNDIWGTNISSSNPRVETIYGGSVVKGENTLNLLDLVKSSFKEEKLNEIRIQESPHIQNPAKIYTGFNFETIYQTPVWDISDKEEVIWKGLNKKSVRYVIDKLNKVNVRLEKNKIEYLDLFYENAKITFEKTGNRISGFLLFENIVKEFCLKKENDNITGVFYTLFDSDIFLGAIIGIKYKDILTYFAASVSDSGRKAGANDYLLWELVKWGKENGCNKFDLLIVNKKEPFLGRDLFKMKYCNNLMIVPFYRYKSIKGLVIKYIISLTHPIKAIRKIKNKVIEINYQ